MLCKLEYAHYIYVTISIPISFGSKRTKKNLLNISETQQCAQRYSLGFSNGVGQRGQNPGYLKRKVWPNVVTFLYIKQMTLTLALILRVSLESRLRTLNYPEAPGETVCLQRAQHLLSGWIKIIYLPVAPWPRGQQPCSLTQVSPFLSCDSSAPCPAFFPFGMYRKLFFFFFF